MRVPVICTTLLIEKSPQALPLGAACIASAIKHNELTKDLCTVELTSFCREDKDFINHSHSIKEAGEYIAENLLKKINNAPKAVFCFSVYVWNRLILENAAARLREKGHFCIAGGPEVTACPESFKDFDSVITGEGEGKVPDVIASLINSSNKQADVAAIVTGKNQSLDTIYSPYLDGTIDPSEYGGALWELARGCPFKCSYCYESKGEKIVRLFPMDRVEKELDLFAKKKIPQVFVLDPTYNANKERAIKLLNLIAKKTPDTFYYFEARAEFLDRQMARAFTKIPCALQIGLQSSDENVLRLVNRPFNRKLFVKNINILNQEGVIFGLDVIYGLPGDSFKGYKNSIDFAMSLYPNNLELFCLSVLPGTDLFDRAEELHLTYETMPPYHIIHTDRFSNNDIKEAEKIAKACSFFYNDGRAVPWFNTICNALHQKPSQFFQQFYKFAEGNQLFKNYISNEAPVSCSHREIEKLQKEYVKKALTERKLNKYVTAALDIITYNGAVSRKIETGKGETVQLHYAPEFIDSEYALSLDFFVNSAKISNVRVNI